MSSPFRPLCVRYVIMIISMIIWLAPTLSLHECCSSSRAKEGVEQILSASGSYLIKSEWKQTRMNESLFFGVVKKLLKQCILYHMHLSHPLPLPYLPNTYIIYDDDN